MPHSGFGTLINRKRDGDQRTKARENRPVLRTFAPLKKCIAMQRLFFTIKKSLPLCFLACSLLACSQTPKSDPLSDRFEQMLRRMDEQMRRGLPADSAGQSGSWQFSPDSSSYFYYHIDTSFNGIGGSDFFRMSPFGNPGNGGFFDMDSLFEQFFGRMDPQSPEGGFDDFPADDGNSEKGADDLLPEERLRLQEQQQNQGDNPGNKPAQPEKQAKPKVKTIRI